MPAIRSIYDDVVQAVIKQPPGHFHPSPVAWEDQILYDYLRLSLNFINIQAKPFSQLLSTAGSVLKRQRGSL